MLAAMSHYCCTMTIGENDMWYLWYPVDGVHVLEGHYCCTVTIGEKELWYLWYPVDGVCVLEGHKKEA